MIGYHYTSADNWNKIQRDGFLTPYPMKQPDLLTAFPNGVNAVWLWVNNPQGVSHAGNILYQVSRRATPRIVKLAVEYSPDQVLRGPMGERIQLSHHGHIDEWVYHDKDSSVLIRNPIPVSRIRLLKAYNIVERLT